MIFLSAIHGINTKATDPSWPWRLQAHHVREGMSVVTQADHYRAYAMPWWNTHVINPKQGKAAARKLELLKDVFPDVPISMACHSNGVGVGVHAAKALIKLGYDVDTLVLIAGALDSDVVQSGLLPLVRKGNINRVVSYSSPKDRVIKPLRFWPGDYGDLGVAGFKRDGRKTGETLSSEDSAYPGKGFFTRWFPYSHSEYFHNGKARHTFNLIDRDMGITRVDHTEPCALNAAV